MAKSDQDGAFNRPQKRPEIDYNRVGVPTKSTQWEPPGFIEGQQSVLTAGMYM